jgi:DNA-binding transcriptional LysR family regulator
MQWMERVGRRLKLRDLHILLAVAKSGSMGKAAAELAISQPSVSKAITDLEHAVGLRLLDRSPQGVEPTIYGRALLKCGVAVFDDLRQGVKALEFLSDSNAGELRIGCTEPLAAGFVPAVIDRLSQRYPQVVFHVVPADSEALKHRELRQRNIELAVAPAREPVLDDELEVQTLFDDRHVVMAGAQSKWARQRKIALDDLLQEPWILPPPDSPWGPHIREAFRAGGLDLPRAQVVTFSMPLHHHLLATGRFITLLPTSLMHLAKHLQLKRLPVELPTFPRPIGIITLKNRMLSPLVQLFIDCACEVAKPLAKGQTLSGRTRNGTSLGHSS